MLSEHNRPSFFKDVTSITSLYVTHQNFLLDVEPINEQDNHTITNHINYSFLMSKFLGENIRKFNKSVSAYKAHNIRISSSVIKLFGKFYIRN